MSKQSDLVVSGIETPITALTRILRDNRDQLSAALPSTITPERFARISVTALTTNPTLQSCTMISICNSIMCAAQLGLELNTPLGHGWLIPYKGICTFQPGYRGLIDLAYRGGSIKDIEAHLVYDSDYFELEYGDEPKLKHRPCLRTDRGEWYGAYSFIRMSDAGTSYLWMPREDIEAVRNKSSQSWRGDKERSPWAMWPEAMRLKTVLKPHLKTKRLSALTETAIGLDDQAEAFAVLPVKTEDAKRELSQALVIEGSMLRDAEEATDALRGSEERQAAVREILDAVAHENLSD